MNPMISRSMMSRLPCILLLSTLAFQTSEAASLQASPVLIEMGQGTQSSAVTIRNTGSTPFDAQTRVFRWTQQGGKESLDETDEVVTSPPITTLQPGTTYSVRVVRANGRPVGREEAFRIFVDQLPDTAAQRSGTVALVMRHSIPVFVMPASGGTAKVDWSVSSRNGRLVLKAQNSGERRLRLSKVIVTLADGKKVNFGNGLLGYVLAGSSMEWLSPGPIGSSATGAGATISATTDIGSVEARANATR